MAQSLSNPPPGFDLLSPKEKLAYVRQLWSRVLSSQAVELSDMQEDELQRRLDAHRADPSRAEAWDDVRERLWAKHGSRDK